jgi:hypothetical protein
MPCRRFSAELIVARGWDAAPAQGQWDDLGGMQEIGDRSGLHASGVEEIGVVRGLPSERHRLWSAGVGCSCRIRAEGLAETTFVQVRAVRRTVCKSVAKASKVRILHLPPPAKTASDLQRCGFRGRWRPSGCDRLISTFDGCSRRIRVEVLVRQRLVLPIGQPSLDPLEGVGVLAIDDLGVHP